MPTPGQPFRQLTGVVVSAGKMMKTVKVRIPGQKWDKHIKKDFPAPYHVLVSDPTESVREGDVIALRNGWRTSKHVHHVVTGIVAPFGPETSARPAIPTEDQRQRQLIQSQLDKDWRKASLGRLAAKARVKKLAAEEGWLAELPDRLAQARKGVKAADMVRAGEAEQKMPPINERAQHNVAQAAKFEQKGLENRAQAKQMEKVTDSVAEGVARERKSI